MSALHVRIAASAQSAANVLIAPIATVSALTVRTVMRLTALMIRIVTAAQLSVTILSRAHVRNAVPATVHATSVMIVARAMRPRLMRLQYVSAVSVVSVANALSVQSVVSAVVSAAAMTAAPAALSHVSQRRFLSMPVLLASTMLKSLT